MTIDMKQFHQTFFEESFEGLDIMENELLNLDVGSADIDVINTIFRAAHSIKGGSGTFGFNEVADFTHVAETLLDEMRDGTRPVIQETVTVLLKSVDIIRGMLTVLRDGGEMDSDNISSVHAELEAALGVENSPSTSDTSANSSSADGWKIDFTPHTGMLRTGNDPVRMLSALAELGELEVKVNISNLPSIKALDPEECHISWHIVLNGDTTEADIKEVFEWVDEDCDLSITQNSTTVVDKVPTSVTTPEKVEIAPEQTQPKTETKTAPTEKTSTRNAKASAGETTSIRVGIDKVDEIINLVGELVITQSMLGQIGGDLEDNIDLAGHRMEKLREGLAQLERNTREIQESVMRIRMLPISFVFSRVPRLIHDLSQKLGKQVELVMTGENTELDKTVMEKIGDPLVHLVRNALDHGIETPDERIAAGKEATGKLYLDAYHKGGTIVIEIADDGAGLNKEKIFKKAVSSGIVGEDETLSDDRVNDLIFQAGFSTAEIVSDVSGRGVGMDVVRKNIKALGGSVSVAPNGGTGTKFTISLPLTLAILDGQLVTVGNETFVVPLISIIESLQIKSNMVNELAGKGEVYKLRDDYIPIIRADEILGMTSTHKDLNNRLMVVVEGEGVKAGIIVDDLLAQQQVVIKSLETNYRQVEGLSGATILGDGTVALILDISGIIELFKNTELIIPPTPPTTDGTDKPDAADEAA